MALESQNQDSRLQAIGKPYVLLSKMTEWVTTKTHRKQESSLILIRRVNQRVKLNQQAENEASTTVKCLTFE